jgi:hypothetical protein
MNPRPAELEAAAAAEAQAQARARLEAEAAAARARAEEEANQAPVGELQLCRAGLPACLAHPGSAAALKQHMGTLAVCNGRRAA